MKYDVIIRYIHLFNEIYVICGIHTHNILRWNSDMQTEYPLFTKSWKIFSTYRSVYENSIECWSFLLCILIGSFLTLLPIISDILLVHIFLWTSWNFRGESPSKYQMDALRTTITMFLFTVLTDHMGC